MTTYTDEQLANMSITARNNYLDDYDAAMWEAFTDAEAEWEIAAERAAERYYEEGPHGGYYAGSMEEARDRWLDSLVG